ncbi:MAG: response regulator [Parcubacteria group bacterium]|nr:response regulator [Parcubacteria group bacterium]
MKTFKAKDPDRAGRIRALIIEDDELQGEVLIRSLQSINRNLEIEWAFSIEEVLLAFVRAPRAGRNPYDLIVADVYLPGDKTGLDLWKICREDFPNIPFILISGMQTIDFMRKAFGPADGDNMLFPCYFQKPFAVDELRSVAEDLLKTYENARECR